MEVFHFLKLEVVSGLLRGHNERLNGGVTHTDRWPHS